MAAWLNETCVQRKHVPFSLNFAGAEVLNFADAEIDLRPARSIGDEEVAFRVRARQRRKTAAVSSIYRSNNKHIAVLCSTSRTMIVVLVVHHVAMMGI